MERSRWPGLRLLLAALAAATLLASATALGADLPGYDPADDPYDPDRHLLQANREQSRNPAAGAHRAPRSRGLELVGSVDLGPFNADVWAHGHYAYVGTWGRFQSGRPELCPATGVKVVDISDPSAPRWVTRVADLPGTSQEDMVVASITTPAYRGDVLAVGIQACRPGAEGGLALVDVTDPERPRDLGFFSTGPWIPGRTPRGVHEMYMFQAGDRAYALLAVPFSEALTEKGDFRIVDVTDPTRPFEVADWNGRRDGGFVPGPGQSFFVHSVWARQDDLALLSYWDLGAVLLDISRPERPRFVGRTVYPAGEEGDTHSAIPARGRQLVITTDEDFNPRDGDWGFARIWSVADEANPRLLANFATANALNPPQRAGFYAVHNPFVRGHTLFLSWYSDGVRIVDISQPSAPREIASYVPAGVPDRLNFWLPGQAFPFVWGVYPTGTLVLASDINYGLYVLRLQ